MVVKRSNFISVEGTDGSGKSTIAKYMGEYLTEMGIPNVVVDSYPRDEDALFKRDLWIQKKVPDIAILALILELRVRVLKETIIPALLEGKMVISDRWHDTTWAYQHYGCGIDQYVMSAVFDSMFDLEEHTDGHPEHIQEWLMEQINCYRTVFLDVSIATSRERVGMRHVTKDAFEKKDDLFFENVERGFRNRMRVRDMDKNMLFVVDANSDIELVKDAVRNILAFQVPQVPPQ